MYWNLNAHKTLHFKTPEKLSFLWYEFVQIFETQIIRAKASLQQTGVNFVGECNACILTLWKLSLFKTFLSSKWNILYQSCYCGFFVCTFHSGLLHTYMKERIQATKTAVILNISLEGSEYGWMKPWKYVKSRVLTQNSGVFKNCFMFFIMKQHDTSMTVCYSMNKCVLWNVQILIKLNQNTTTVSMKSRLSNVQKLFCGRDAFRKKLGFLSCMNVMKRWLRTFSK